MSRGTTLSGARVLITGGTRGIGRLLAAGAVERGAEVTVWARNPELGAQVADELGVRFLAVDVADAAAVAEAAQETGSIDMLVNNAGVIEPIARLAEADPVEWDRAIDINLKGVFHGMRAAVPVMRRQGAGTVLTLSSGAAHRPLEGWSAYCASKAGAAMLTRALHEEEGHWLRVMGLSPGTVATDMQRAIRASGVNPVAGLDWAEHIPADWPGRALVWMCGAAADRFCGQELSLRDAALRAEIGLA